MGWSFGWNTKEEVVKYLETQIKVIKSTVKGRTHWYVGEDKEGKRFIGLNLIEKQGGEWGYKDMEESMGPCYYNCPVTYLDMAPTPTSQYAAGWREKVRAHHEARKASQSIERKVGDVVAYGGHNYRLLSPSGPRRGWYVEATASGSRYRMGVKVLAQSAKVE